MDGASRCLEGNAVLWDHRGYLVSNFFVTARILSREINTRSRPWRKLPDETSFCNSRHRKRRFFPWRNYLQPLVASSHQLRIDTWMGKYGNVASELVSARY